MGRRGLWTGLRLRQISRLLRRLGILVAPNTVRRLLQQLGYALHANRKSLCSPCPERDRQFRYLARQRHRFAQEQAPIISVDTKKRELVGRFKNAGRVWSREPIQVLDHDFPSLGQGVAIPYGVYDLQANRGCVTVGTSRNTPAFAVESIRRWWLRDGRRRYPHSSRLLILADNGGSNGAACHLWKQALQEKLVDPFGLFVTVCHYPSGASKWNPIEHRLFSEISKHWAGQPLVDYTTTVRLIRETCTASGLSVSCSLDHRSYPTAIKLSPEQLGRISLYRHAVLPIWNYTLLPNQNGN
jgi:Rhodopirellula transposase DDE domain